MPLGQLYNPTASAQLMGNIPAGLEGIMIPQLYDQMQQEQQLAQIYNKQVTDRYNPNVMAQQEIANTQSRGMNPMLLEEKRLANEQAQYLMPTHQSAGLQAKADMAANPYGDIARSKASSAKTNLDIQNAIQAITMLNSGASDEQYLAYVQQTSPKEVPGAAQKLKQLGRQGYIKMVTDMVSKTAQLSPEHIQKMAQEAAKPASVSIQDWQYYLDADAAGKAALERMWGLKHPPAVTPYSVTTSTERMTTGPNGPVLEKKVEKGPGGAPAPSAPSASTSTDNQPAWAFGPAPTGENGKPLADGKWKDANGTPFGVKGGWAYKLK